METNFLRSVAGAYVEHGALDSVFVLPNRRSLKFFQMHLGREYGKRTGKPLFAPEIITINDFFGNLCGLVPADKVEQLYILYREYIALKYEELGEEEAMAREPFDDFVHWGETILSDFNDVDKYMVDPRQLFTNIRELKEIDSDFSFLSPRQLEAVRCFWTNYLKGGSFSEKKEFFSSVWGIMYPLYCNFNAALEKKGTGYEGQIYRRAAEDVAGHDFPKRVVVIGFNAPNMCERRVMKYLREAGKGDFYWDFYGELLTDPRNGASAIISECVKEYPSLYRIEGGAMDPREQKFKVYASPSGVGQAFVVQEILEQLYPAAQVPQEAAFSTAVVLPDENLLMPVLNSIPGKFRSINVTMGYPIATTSLNSFMQQLQQLQQDARSRGGKWCFYHKSLLDILSHEYLKKIAPQAAASIREKVIAGNMIYVPQESGMLHDDSFISLIVQPVREPAEIAVWQMEILKVLDEKLGAWDREFIYQYWQRINSLAGLGIPMGAATYFRLAGRLCSSIIVPFKGEPLAGLQVMGTLETRALDFENVIIISANEGKFPSSNVGQSIIPYNLRVGFGLPTYELQDGIAAYHFYRSICRARNVFMVYDTRNEGLGSGEASRYVKQLKYHFGLDVEEIAVSAPPAPDSAREPLKVEKTPEVMGRLISMFTGAGEKSLSASAINNYIACPLKFYVENVEGMQEEEEVSESVESNVFGSIFHHVMEGLYKEYEGKVVGKGEVSALAGEKGLIGKLILEGFAEYMHIEELGGQHRIVEALIRKYVALALKEDENLAPFRYIAGERRFRYRLPIRGGELQVNFKAFIDRIDTLVEGNSIRIVDYKTGSVTAPGSSFGLGQLFDKEGDGRYKAILQLYLYAVIYFAEKLEKGDAVEDAILAIYPLKKIAREHLVQLLMDNASLVEFRRLLTECVEEIFNKDVPFFANPQEKHCSYCSLAAICGK